MAIADWASSSHLRRLRGVCRVAPAYPDAALAPGEHQERRQSSFPDRIGHRNRSSIPDPGRASGRLLCRNLHPRLPRRTCEPRCHHAREASHHCRCHRSSDPGPASLLQEVLAGLPDAVALPDLPAHRRPRLFALQFLLLGTAGCSRPPSNGSLAPPRRPCRQTPPSPFWLSAGSSGNRPGGVISRVRHTLTPFSSQEPR
jgi:hypothetical protein